MGKIADISAKPLTRDYVHGAAQGAFEQLAVASFLAPMTPVAGMVGRYSKFDSKNRFRLPKTRRELNGRATRIGFGAGSALFEAQPHALDLPIDKVEQMEDSVVENIIQEGADMVADVAALSHEVEVVDSAISVLDAGKLAIDFGANADPLKFMDSIVLKVLKAARMGSLLRVRILYGATAWLEWKNHPAVKAYIKSSTRRGESKLQVDEGDTTEMIITRPEIKTTYSVYDQGAAGLDPDIEFVLDKSIVVFATKGNPTRLDPSFMKTFAPRGQFMVAGEYETEDKRGDVVKYDWNCIPEVVNPDAAQLLYFN